MKKLILIPFALLASATPAISLVSCDNSGWISWDYINQGEYTHDIPRAEYPGAPDTQQCTILYYDWLKEDRNNLAYDILLSNNLQAKHYDIYQKSIKINNIDSTNERISFEFKFHKKASQSTNLADLSEYIIDIKAENTRYNARVPKSIGKWCFGSVVNDWDVETPWEALTEIKNDQLWRITGDYTIIPPSSPKIEYKGIDWDYQDARQMSQSQDLQKCSALCILYNSLFCLSVFLENIDIPTSKN